MPESAPPFVLILSGPPGAGKTTVGPLVADHFEPSVCFDADLLWQKIRQGHIEPWLPESDEQNRVVLSVAAATALEFAHGGYSVVLEGIIGPWMLDLFTGPLGRAGVALHYVVLRPPLDVCLQRAAARRADPRHIGALGDEGPIRQLWEAFADLGPLEGHVVEASGLSPAETAELVWSRLRSGAALLGS